MSAVIADWNALDEADFVARCRELFEHSPWVVERAAKLPGPYVVGTGTRRESTWTVSVIGRMSSRRWSAASSGGRVIGSPR